MAVSLLAVPVAPSVAGAQAPEAVRDGQVAPGVYIGTAPIDPTPLTATVQRARAAGIQLVIVVAEDPRPDPAAFAIRVRQLGVGDPVLVFGPDGQVGASSDELDGSELLEARTAAADAATPDVAADAFVGALLDDEDTGIPDLVGEVSRFGAIALALLVGTAVADRALRRRRAGRRTTSALEVG